MKLSVTKQYRTDTAHYLDDYAGKCRNLHGHSYLYTVQLEVDAPQVVLDRVNMLTDFGEFKRFFLANVEPWDHSLLTPLPQAEVDRLLQEPNMLAAPEAYHDYKLLRVWGIRDIKHVYGFGENPTAEAMAQRLCAILVKEVEQDLIPLPPQDANSRITVSVTVQETPGCQACATMTAQQHFILPGGTGDQRTPL